MSTPDDLPYTERKNPLSLKLSDVSVREMLQIVVDCHKQIFTENLSPSFTLASFASKFDSFSTKAVEFLQSGKKAAIILGGCGTSGRISFLAALNQALYFPKCNVDVLYSCAGGDKALFKSVEFVEDDDVLGRENLERLSADYDRILYIGISVGLWAPYIAGQLDYAIKNPGKFMPVVIGFNPPYLARNAPIKDFDRTFRDVVLEMEKLGHFLITPVILPEALSGSSRMKGGVATIVILDMLFCCLNSKLCPDDYKTVDMDKMLASFTSLLDMRCLVSENFASLLTSVADKMRKGGSFLLEADGDLGVLGGFDYAEALPTFNAAPGEVIPCMHAMSLDNSVDWVAEKFLRVKGKGNFSGKMTTFAQVFGAAGVLFDETRIGNVEKDALVTMQVRENAIVLSSCSKTAEFAFENLYEFDRLKPFYVQTIAKLVFQLISTIVFCQLGKVYKNIMIDVKTSNTKLLHRAIRSVADVTGCDLPTARRAIIGATKQNDSLSEAELAISDDDLIKESAEMCQIVPCAVVIVLTGCSPHEAFQRVRGRGRLCEIVDQLLVAKKN